MAISEEDYVGRLKQYGMRSIVRSGLLQSSISSTNGSTILHFIQIEMHDPKILVLATTQNTTWLDSRIGNNWFPFGSNINAGDWIAMDENNSWYQVTQTSPSVVIGNNQPNIEQSIKFITNQSGNTHDILFDSAVRYVFNQGALSTPSS